MTFSTGINNTRSLTFGKQANRSTVARTAQLGTQSILRQGSLSARSSSGTRATPLATTSTIATPPQPSPFGINPTIGITVSSNAVPGARPSGFAQVFLDNRALGDLVPLNANSQQVFPIPGPLLGVGTYSVQAAYRSNRPDLFTNSPRSNTLNVRVVKAPTNTVAATGPAFIHGQAVGVNTAVSSGVVVGRSPGSGTMEIRDGRRVLGTSGVSRGVAAINLGVLDAGTYSFRARFRGNDNYNESTSAPVNLVVQRAGTTSSVFTRTPSVATGQNVSFDVNVLSTVSGRAVPSGQYRVFTNGSPSRNLLTVEGRQTTFTQSFRNPGQYAIQVQYLGNTTRNFNNSALSQPITVTVTRRPRSRSESAQSLFQ